MPKSKGETRALVFLRFDGLRLVTRVADSNLYNLFAVEEEAREHVAAMKPGDVVGWMDNYTEDLDE